MKTFSFKLSEYELSEIARVSKILHISKSKLARDAIAYVLSHYDKNYKENLPKLRGLK